MSTLDPKEELGDTPTTHYQWAPAAGRPSPLSLSPLRRLMWVVVGMALAVPLAGCGAATQTPETPTAPAAPSPVATAPGTLEETPAPQAEETAVATTGAATPAEGTPAAQTPPAALPGDAPEGVAQ